MFREGRWSDGKTDPLDLSVTTGLAARPGSGGLLSLHGSISFRLGRRGRGSGCKRGLRTRGRGRPLLVLPSTAIMGILRHGLESGARLRVVILSTSGGIARLGMLRRSVTPL